MASELTPQKNSHATAPTDEGYEQQLLEGRGEAVDQILQNCEQHSDAALEHLRNAVSSIDKAASHLQSQKPLTSLGRALLEPIVQRKTSVLLSALVLVPLLTIWGVLPKRTISEARYKELLQEAIATMDARKPEEAIVKLTYLIDRKPDPFVLCRRAYAKISTGDGKGALSDCEAALKLDPKYARAHYLEYLVHKRDGQEGAARQALNNAVVLRDPLALSTLRLRDEKEKEKEKGSGSRSADRAPKKKSENGSAH